MAAEACQGPGIAAGFQNPVFESQASFRALLEAMAHPGRIVAISAEADPPPPLNSASFAVVLTLCDHETPLWLDNAASTPGIASSLRFHCGARLVEDPGQAAFALCADSLPELQGFARGTADFPDRSATVICQVASLGEGASYRLRGPGVEGIASLRVAGLPQYFASQWAANRALFPQGIDLILTQGRNLCALPRSLAIERET